MYRPGSFLVNHFIKHFSFCFEHQDFLTLSYKTFENDQTYFKNLAV